MIGCGLALKTAGMTDAEFWAFVFPDSPDRWEPDDDDIPDRVVGWCARCGDAMRAEDHEHAVEMADYSFCDECVDSQLPDLQDER